MIMNLKRRKERRKKKWGGKKDGRKESWRSGRKEVRR